MINREFQDNNNEEHCNRLCRLWSSKILVNKLFVHSGACSWSREDKEEASTIMEKFRQLRHSSRAKFGAKKWATSTHNISLAFSMLSIILISILIITIPTSTQEAAKNLDNNQTSGQSNSSKFNNFGQRLMDQDSSIGSKENNSSSKLFSLSLRHLNGANNANYSVSTSKVINGVQIGKNYLGNKKDYETILLGKANNSISSSVARPSLTLDTWDELINLPAFYKVPQASNSNKLWQVQQQNTSISNNKRLTPSSLRRAARQRIATKLGRTAPTKPAPVDSAQESLSIGIVIKPDEPQANNTKTGQILSRNDNFQLEPPMTIESIKSIPTNNYRQQYSYKNFTYWPQASDDIEHVIHVHNGDNGESEQMQDNLIRSALRNSDINNYNNESARGENLKNYEQSGHWSKEKAGEEQEEQTNKKKAEAEAKKLFDLGHNKHGWKNIYHKEEYAQHLKYHDIFHDKDWQQNESKQAQEDQAKKGAQFNESIQSSYSDKNKHGNEYDFVKGSQWKRAEQEHQHDDDEGESDEDHSLRANQRWLSKQQQQQPRQAFLGNTVDATASNAIATGRQHNRVNGSQTTDSDSIWPDDDEVLEQMKARLNELSGEHEVRKNSTKDKDLHRSMPATGMLKASSSRLAPNTSQVIKVLKNRNGNGEFPLHDDGSQAEQPNTTDDEQGNGDDSSGMDDDGEGDPIEDREHLIHKQQFELAKNTAGNANRRQRAPNESSNTTNKNERQRNELRLKLELDLGKSSSPTSLGTSDQTNRTRKQSISKNKHSSRLSDSNHSTNQNGPQQKQHAWNKSNSIGTSNFPINSLVHKKEFEGNKTRFLPKNQANNGLAQVLPARPIFVKHLQMNGGISLLGQQKLAHEPLHQNNNDGLIREDLTIETGAHNQLVNGQNNDGFGRNQMLTLAGRPTLHANPSFEFASNKDIEHHQQPKSRDYMILLGSSPTSSSSGSSSSSINGGRRHQANLHPQQHRHMNNDIADQDEPSDESGNMLDEQNHVSREHQDFMRDNNVDLSQIEDEFQSPFQAGVRPINHQQLLTPILDVMESGSEQTMRLPHHLAAHDHFQLSPAKYSKPPLEMTFGSQPTVMFSDQANQESALEQLAASTVQQALMSAPISSLPVTNNRHQVMSQINGSPNQQLPFRVNISPFRSHISLPNLLSYANSILLNHHHHQNQQQNMMMAAASNNHQTTPLSFSRLLRLPRVFDLASNSQQQQQLQRPIRSEKFLTTMGTPAATSGHNIVESPAWINQQQLLAQQLSKALQAELYSSIPTNAQLQQQRQHLQQIVPNRNVLDEMNPVQVAPSGHQILSSASADLDLSSNAGDLMEAAASTNKLQVLKDAPSKSTWDSKQARVPKNSSEWRLKQANWQLRDRKPPTNPNQLKYEERTKHGRLNLNELSSKGKKIKQGTSSQRVKQDYMNVDPTTSIAEESHQLPNASSSRVRQSEDESRRKKKIEEHKNSSGWMLMDTSQLLGRFHHQQHNLKLNVSQPVTKNQRDLTYRLVDHSQGRTKHDNQLSSSIIKDQSNESKMHSETTKKPPSPGSSLSLSQRLFGSLRFG